MKTLCSFILFISCALSLSAQTDTSYDLNVGEFSELRVSDGINVDYTSDPDKAGRAFSTVRLSRPRHSCLPTRAAASPFSFRPKL